MIEITIKLSDINYESAVEEYLPIISKKIGEKEELGMIEKLIASNSPLATKMVKAALVTLPQNLKDDIAVGIIEKYKEEIGRKTMSFAQEKGLTFSFEGIDIKTV